MVREVSSSAIAYSTTLGTTKKFPSRAGAFRSTGIRVAARSNPVRTALHLHGCHRGHRFDPVHIDLGKLIDEGEYGVYLATQVLDLFLSDGYTRQMRDAPDGSGIHGHAILVRKPTAYSRVTFLRATLET